MGAKSRLIYANRWRDGTIGATLTSENPQHPGSDSQIDTKSMFWRTTNDTDDPTLLPCDLGDEYDIDFVALLGHNIPDTATIYFEGADDEAFAGGDLVTRTLTYNATNIFEFITTFKKQWVRVRITTPGNPDDYIQIATVICGKYAELNRRFAPEYEIGEEDFSEEEYSDSQVLFAQEKETLNIRRYSYQALNTASITEVLAMFKECKTIKAFAFCHDHSDPNLNTLWIRNAELNSPVCRNGVWYWEMAIKEVI